MGGIRKHYIKIKKNAKKHLVTIYFDKKDKKIFDNYEYILLNTFSIYFVFLILN